MTLQGQGGDCALLGLVLQDVTKFRDSSASVPFGHRSQLEIVRTGDIFPAWFYSKLPC